MGYPEAVSKPHQPTDPESVRLQKYLSERGVASRRMSAVWIREGRVTVNGRSAAGPGQRIRTGIDAVAFDGTLVPVASGRRRTIALYKPRGYLCSNRSQQGRTVYDLIRQIPERLVCVGRLDRESEGLLLMSNDGDLVQRLTHPRYGQEKVYHVDVSGALTPDALRILSAPILIDGRHTRPAVARCIAVLPVANRHRIEFILSEGRKRQIRELCRSAGLTVERLVRVRIRSLTVGGLKPGEWRDLSEREIRRLA
jgi:23S rRNA pseudouridine2605 synthase